MGTDGIRIANAHEFDIRPSTFRRLQEQPSPPGGVVPDDPAGLTLLANGQVYWKKGGSAFDYFFRRISPSVDQGGEMIYWERPGGGRVFNAGAIGAGWVLSVDPKMAALLRNVLAHFGVPPFTQRESFREGAAIVARLLWRGIAPGGPLRAWHFLRSLPLTRPRLLPLAINDWIVALAMRRYAERQLLGA